MVLPEFGLSRRRLFRGVLRSSIVNAQASGCRLTEKEASKLESVWQEHLNLASKNVGRSVVRALPTEDTFDDLDPSGIGSDGAAKQKHIVSGVKRNPKVRRWVLKRSRGVCERLGCHITRSFAGFLDVHHILGAAKGDRVWNCVALCPNCHRETHCAPNRKKINKELLRFAKQFRGTSKN